MFGLHSENLSIDSIDETVTLQIGFDIVDYLFEITEKLCSTKEISNHGFKEIVLYRTPFFYGNLKLKCSLVEYYKLHFRYPRYFVLVTVYII
jgi:hypothetical protein